MRGLVKPNFFVGRYHTFEFHTHTPPYSAEEFESATLTHHVKALPRTADQIDHFLCAVARRNTQTGGRGGR